MAASGRAGRRPARCPRPRRRSPVATPNRSPERSRRWAARTARDARRGRVAAGRAPRARAGSRAASATVRVSGPALVERRGEGDHPVAGDPPVGRLQPDDAAERRRLADRPARYRCRARPAPARPRRRRPSRRRSRRGPATWSQGLRSRRRRSSRSTSPWRTRPCSSCRGRGARRLEARDHSRRCTGARSPRGSSSRGRAARPWCRRVLDRDRDAGERTLAGRGGLLETTGRRSVRRAGRRRPTRTPGCQLAGIDARERLGRRQLANGFLAHEGPGDGTLNAPSEGSGAFASAASRSRLGSGTSARRTFSSSTT